RAYFLRATALRDRRLYLDQWADRARPLQVLVVCFLLAQHVGGTDAGAVERLFAIRSRGPTHAAFHVGNAGTTRAGANVAAGGADGQVFGANRANFVQLGRMAPDVKELLAAHIAAGKRKLYAGKNVSV